MGHPTVSISMVGDPPVLEISKDTSVPDPFWLRMRSEFPARGLRSPSRLSTTPSEFVNLRHVLRMLCEQYRVRLVIDDRTRSLLGRLELDQRALLHVMGPSQVSTVSLSERLEGGRFRRPLLEFQQRDLSHLLQLPHGANFSVPGAGKTTPSCSAVAGTSNSTTSGTTRPH